jgi:Dyp-type peroxidase family
MASRHGWVAPRALAPAPAPALAALAALALAGCTSNSTDGTVALGKLDAGSFFIAVVRDPRAHYVPIEEEMSRSDRMRTECLETVTLALFVVPPRVQHGATLGDSGALVGHSLFA